MQSNSFNVDIDKKLSKNKILNIKLGFDPTAPDLHLGHFVVLKKAKELQDMGHNVIIIVGDFTASIGDPSGKNKLRPALDENKIDLNAKTYTDQVFLILDKEKTIIKKNSEWLKKLNFKDILQLISTISVSQILAREDFKNRLEQNNPLFMHEIMYPIMQGFDSFAIDADIELGGTDQTFNLLVGREIQKSKNKEPQAVFTCPILVGLDGEKKMSKSLNNHIGLLDSAENKFGKTMSLPDNAINNWFEILFNFSKKDLNDIENKFLNPKDRKILLAKKIVEQFHSKEIAKQEEEKFIKKFAKKEFDETSFAEEEFLIKENEIKLTEFLKLINWSSSNSDSVRKIEQGAVKINNIKILDKNHCLKSNNTFIISVGKINIKKIKLKNN